MKTKEIQLNKVDSSNVMAVGYDKETKTLRVMFKNESVYDYSDVPKELYTDLNKTMEAGESVGRFIRQSIQSADYKYKKVDADSIPKERIETAMMICNVCGFPVVFTLAFPDAEFYCLQCGSKEKILGDKAKEVEETTELKKQLKFAQDIFNSLRMNICLADDSIITGCDKCSIVKEKYHKEHMTKKEKEKQKIALDKLQTYVDDYNKGNDIIINKL